MKQYLVPYRIRLGAQWTMVLLNVVAGLSIPPMVGAAIDGPITNGDLVGLWRYAGVVAALGALDALLSLTRRYFQTTTAMAIEADIRDVVYGHLQRLHTGFHDRWQTGQLLSRVTTDLGMIRRFFAGGMVFLIMSTFMITLILAQLLWIEWRLALVVAASAVPLFLLGRGFFKNFLPAARAEQDQSGEVSSVAEESALGIRAVKALGRGPLMAARFGKEAAHLRDLGIRKSYIASRSWSAFDAIASASLGTTLILGSIMVANGGLSLGQLSAFIMLQLGMLWPIEAAGWVLAHGNEAMTAADRIYEVLDTEPAIRDRPGARARDRSAIRGALAFEGVEFAYDDDDRKTLRGVDLAVKPGETLAIAGKTGSGKTTLVSLPSRLNDPTGGRITLDGTDIRDIRLDSLRRAVTTAFEEATLFSMSVRENLALGRPDADEHDLLEALRVAQAEFVHDLPYGLDTRIGEQGLSLSGGQRQRLALARAVVVRPAVLVLDDPLSALDVHTEELVERALEQVLQDTTALIVVHRPSTVALADRVALLHEGRIAAVGRHSELMESSPDYVEVLSAESEEVAA
ncbi:ABC transporter ATP-binding protein/permease [Glycomyces sp. L485]|uniref:ABC transporter ATP-binding protein n=1 Tax=Glycomyces sp. L485 TaxID=2909235 RepID=UPI001F4B1B39|nr:ABC transporter ATP-binding protein [Glycomyces sp. L485]MCH7230730.1 ABC transporter ATP-binding protein/permease [Glycomyces sp. L485]